MVIGFGILSVFLKHNRDCVHFSVLLTKQKDFSCTVSSLRHDHVEELFRIKFCVESLCWQGKDFSCSEPKFNIGISLSSYGMVLRKRVPVWIYNHAIEKKKGACLTSVHASDVDRGQSKYMFSFSVLFKLLLA